MQTKISNARPNSHNVSQNLIGYEAHLFIRELETKFIRDNIGVIAENKEKYISCNVKFNVKLAGVSNQDRYEVPKNIQFRFIDNCRFVATSLDKLPNNLDNEEEDFRLMRRKGVYPYECTDS